MRLNLKAKVQKQLCECGLDGFNTRVYTIITKHNDPTPPQFMLSKKQHSPSLKEGNLTKEIQLSF